MFFDLFLEKCVIVYLDDILILSRSWEQHLQQLQQVLNFLRQQKTFLNLDKCSFTMKSIKYLGYGFDSTSIQVNLEKIQIFKE